MNVGDILFSMIGGNIGSMIVITEENYIDMAIKNVALFKQYNYELSLTGYLEVFLRSQVPNMQAIAKGGAVSTLSSRRLKVLLATNFPIRGYTRDEALDERITYFIFPLSVAKENRVEHLSDLLANEADAIISTALLKYLPL